MSQNNLNMPMFQENIFGNLIGLTFINTLNNLNF